ncbi:MAG: shikimate kinase [Lachnospiraceae bacterium]
MSRNIVLIGYMGSGKSTVAKELYRKTGMKILDTDLMIVEKQGRSINAIFAEDGETAFRDMETKLLEELSGSAAYQKNCILSTGGGMPVREENRALLKKLGTVFFLKATTDTILEHVKNDTERPLLRNPDRREKIEEMLAQRTPAYEDAADYVIDTDHKSVVEVTEYIWKLIKNNH